MHTGSRLQLGERAADEDRRTASLAGLAVILALLVLGLMLVQALHRESVLEDCLLAGRRTCLTIAPAGPPA
ncbi:MAG TPA: hypothetical protein VFA03_02985 [Acetobacteraceae bacterium]|nr:hypothetical protein [Acetobacteraceae bacterium]